MRKRAIRLRKNLRNNYPRKAGLGVLKVGYTLHNPSLLNICHSLDLLSTFGKFFMTHSDVLKILIFQSLAQSVTFTTYLRTIEPPPVSLNRYNCTLTKIRHRRLRPAFPCLRQALLFPSPPSSGSFEEYLRGGSSAVYRTARCTEWKTRDISRAATSREAEAEHAAMTIEWLRRTMDTWTRK